MRTAAGRRALQLALLVGGLFALGLLYGEQAHAAEGVPSTTSAEAVRQRVAADGIEGVIPEAVTSAVTAPTNIGADKAHESSPLPADRILRPVTEQVVGSVDERVVRPVGDVVAKVTEGLAEVQAEVQAKIPPPSLLPSLPTSPASPILPGLPERPGLPGLPGRPELPVPPLLPGQTLPAPVTAAPQPGSVADSPATGGHASGDRAADGAATTTYGPVFVSDATPAGAATRAAAHRVPPTEYAPVRHTPAGDPGGVLGNRSATDSGTSRHGDAHAVPLNHRAPLPLVPGTAARIDAAETRDRHRDIPVSPA